MTLPEGVEKTTVRKPNGKVYTYYYWNPGRGTDREESASNYRTPTLSRWHFGPKSSVAKHRNRQHTRLDPLAILYRATAAAMNLPGYRKARSQTTK